MRFNPNAFPSKWANLPGQHPDRRGSVGCLGYDLASRSQSEWIPWSYVLPHLESVRMRRMTQRELKKLHCGSTTCSWVKGLTCWKLDVWHLVTRQVDPDVLPQLVGGELVVDKILQLLLQPDHEISAWKKDLSFSWYKRSSEKTHSSCYFLLHWQCLEQFAKLFLTMIKIPRWVFCFFVF